MDMNKYPKIKELGDADNAGILTVGDEIIVEEKIDGANMRFMLTDNGLVFGSRNNIIASEDMLISKTGTNVNINKQFVRAIRYIMENISRSALHEEIDKRGDIIVFGENCAPHTIRYNWDEMPPYLGFDVGVVGNGFLNQDNKTVFFKSIGLPVVPLILRGGWGEINEKDLDVPNSVYYKGIAEGIVIKNYEKQLFAKMRTDEFGEKAKGVGASKKWVNTEEERFIAMYCTNARIEKFVHKLVDDGLGLSMSLMSELPRRIYIDIWEEEWQEIAFGNNTINTRELRKLVAKRCVVVLRQVLSRAAFCEQKIENDNDTI